MVWPDRWAAAEQLSVQTHVHPRTVFTLPVRWPELEALSEGGMGADRTSPSASRTGPGETRHPRETWKKGDPAHPAEPVDPCCLPALGEFTGCAPRGIRRPV